MAALTVLGIGNILMRDEGVGVRVLEVLRGLRPWPAEVEFVDGGAGGLNLLTVIERAEELFVIDAAAMGLPAGEFRFITPAQLSDESETIAGRMSLHEVPFIETLRLCEQFTRRPEKVTILAIQPAIVDRGRELSAEIQAAFPQLLSAAQQWIENRLREIGI